MTIFQSRCDARKVSLNRVFCFCLFACLFFAESFETVGYLTVTYMNRNTHKASFFSTLVCVLRFRCESAGHRKRRSNSGFFLETDNLHSGSPQ